MGSSCLVGATDWLLFAVVDSTGQRGAIGEAAVPGDFTTYALSLRRSLSLLSTLMANAISSCKLLGSTLPTRQSLTVSLSPFKKCSGVLCRPTLVQPPEYGTRLSNWLH